MPFVGIPSFLRAPIVEDLGRLDADVAVMGIPTDEGSPFMPGSRFGPRAIREHSLRFTGDRPGYYDPQRGRRFLEREFADGLIVDVGDADVLPTNVDATFTGVTEMTRRLLEGGAMPLVLGGDHAITYPVVRAFDGPLHVLHFDAHLDYMPFVHGVELTNAHAFRHIARMAHVSSLTQVGIRSIRNTERMHRDSLGDGNRVVTMDEYRDVGPSGIVEAHPGRGPLLREPRHRRLGPLARAGMRVRGTGWDGLPDLRDTLATVAERADVVGFDLVEVNPQLDVGTGVTSYLAAHLAIEFLGRSHQPRWAARRDERAERRAQAGRRPSEAGAGGSIRSGSTCICTSTRRRRRARARRPSTRSGSMGPDTTSSSRASTATSMTR